MGYCKIINIRNTKKEDWLDNHDKEIVKNFLQENKADARSFSMMDALDYDLVRQLRLETSYLNFLIDLDSKEFAKCIVKLVADSVYMYGNLLIFSDVSIKEFSVDSEAMDNIRFMRSKIDKLTVELNETSDCKQLESFTMGCKVGTLIIKGKDLDTEYIKDRLNRFAKVKKIEFNEV